MNTKRGRGRPRVTEKIAGDSSTTYERVITGGRKYRSRRSISDTAYAISAGIILTKADSEIEDLAFIMDNDKDYMCRSILSQLGRMSKTEGYDDASVVIVAKAAIQQKKNGYSVKEIEKYIQRGRLTGEW